MATFQSQINILAKAIINLHNNINNSSITNQSFKIMKFNYYDIDTAINAKYFHLKNILVIMIN